MRKKSLAFTLAEVLITLTIIGVIAAITIPTLMQNYKKHEVEVKVKEAYSIISNAIKMAEAEHGKIADLMPSDMSTATTDWVDNYFKPYLKVEKDGYACSNHLNPITVPYRSPKKSNDLSSTVSGTDYDICNTRHLFLNNGFVFSVGAPYGYVLGNGTVATIVVNIDGFYKGKNQLGNDIFAFAYNKDGNIYGAVIENYMYSFTTPSNVKSNCLSGGYTCAQYIMQNGWKIPDDYPVKKF